MKKNVKCVVKRGNLKESEHLINCIVLDSNEKIIFKAGDINSTYCLRSTLKPFQCAASIKLGVHEKFNLSKKEIAVMCSSHHGEQRHIKTVKSILKKINLDEGHLGCGFHYPLDKKSKSGLYSKKYKASNVYNNCSGKHAGILALIKFLEQDTKNYIYHTHPVHIYLNDYIQSQAKMKAEHFAIDGCSLPTPYFKLKTLALMYLKLINANSDSELFSICDAMTTHPNMISGRKGFDTFIMKELSSRVISKGGAEGMQAIAMKTKKYGNISLALKVDDGNHRANYISCIKILSYLEIIQLNEEKLLLEFINEKQKNINGIHTGQLVCHIY